MPLSFLVMFVYRSRQLIYLGRHDKVIFMQAVDFVGLELHSAVTPANGDISVMVFCLA